MKQLLFYSIVAVLLFACTPMKKVVYLNQESEINIEAPTPVKHLLQAGDVLHVKILGVQKESFNIFNIENNANNAQTTSANLFMNGFTINSKGFIEVPTIGIVEIAGLTIEEAKNKIQSKADKFLINSTVIVKHINFEITVLGEVNRPGTYTVYKDNMTIFEALGLAGDITDFGDRTAIKRIRGTQVDVLNITQQGVLGSSDFYLKANDVIYVDPLNSVRMRNSKAQIYLSAISSIGLIANIVLRTMGFY
tara:strand:+ start:193 stop:942 length:750 start_codon:yes stop_codon:yes gene_type:complete